MLFYKKFDCVSICTDLTLYPCLLLWAGVCTMLDSAEKIELIPAEGCYVLQLDWWA